MARPHYNIGYDQVRGSNIRLFWGSPDLPWGFDRLPNWRGRRSISICRETSLAAAAVTHLGSDLCLRRQCSDRDIVSMWWQKTAGSSCR